MKCKTFSCLFKSNINVVPLPKYVVSNFTSVIDTSGFPFVTLVFPRLSLLSQSVHRNQCTTTTEHYTEGAAFSLTVAMSLLSAITRIRGKFVTAITFVAYVVH
jgi:hypothetical protein